jgi:hypothetical protein
MIKSTIKTCILLGIILLSGSIVAQEKSDSTHVRKVNMGLSLGSDIGGAIPFPVSKIPGTVNAYPQVNTALGISISSPFARKWGVGMEVTYKTVAMKADARVNSQRFNMDNATMFFTGTATTEMKFTMLEIPLYAGYRINNRNTILAGLYGSIIFSGTFIADPLKGYSGQEPNVAETTDMSDITMDFSQYLSGWDMGATVGYMHAIFDRLKLALRLSMGFKDIFKSSNSYFDYSMLHIRGGITLTYDFVRLKIND